MADLDAVGFSIRHMGAEEQSRRGRFARNMLFATLAGSGAIVGFGAYFLSLLG